jgi:hypothetical protein
MEKSELIMKRTLFQHFPNVGCWMAQCEKIEIRQCTFDDIGDSAVCIREGTNLTLIDCRMKGINGNGVQVSGRSNLDVRDCSLMDLSYPGFAIIEESSAAITSTKMERIAMSGIAVRGANAVVIKKVSIDNSRECGVSISDTKQKTLIQDSMFMNCHVAGIECYNRSVVTVEKCQIKQSPLGFSVHTLGNLEAFDNGVMELQIAMAKVVYSGTAKIMKTKCRDVPSQAILETTGLYLLQQNGKFPSITNIPSEVGEKVVLGPVYSNENGNLCLKCRETPRNVFFMDCGHRVYCHECAIASKEAKEVCPLCRFPITAISMGFDADMENFCTICCENEPNSLIIPCGHLGICCDCVTRWFHDHTVCPICGREQSTYRHVIWEL